MKIMMFLISFTYLSISSFGQDNIIINYKNNISKRVDSLEFIGVTKPDFRFGGWIFPTGKVSVDSGALTSVYLYRDGIQTTTSADYVKNIIFSYENRQFVYESVSNLEIANENLSKKAIFLFRMVDGRVKLYSFNGFLSSGDLAICNNSSTLFTYENFKDTCLVFFKNQPKIWSKIKKMAKYNELDYNALPNYIEFINSSFEYNKEKSDYLKNKTFIKEFIKVIKSNDDFKLKEFSDKLFFDKKSCEYLRFFNQNYYGMPADSDEEYDAYKNQYYVRLLNFKRNLEKNNNLSNLELVGVSSGKSIALNKGLDIYIQDVFFKIKFGESDNEIRIISLGKVVTVKGVKKTITFPKI